MQQGNIVIYATEKDRDWISVVDQIAKTKDWSRSKVIKWALREMIAGNEPQPQIKTTINKPIPVPEPEEEKISPEDIFADIEAELKEEPVIDEGSTLQEQAANCKEKVLMPSNHFNCDYKNRFQPVKPYCPICWQMYEIWGEAIVKQKGR